MRQDNWSDILHLLSIMILADEKVYQEEVEAFKQSAVSLRDKLCPEVMLTKHMVFEWFTLHRDDIRDAMVPELYPTTVSNLLNNLKSFPQKRELLVALLEIAVSDGYQHGAESRLMTMASKAWDIELDSLH